MSLSKALGPGRVAMVLFASNAAMFVLRRVLAMLGLSSLGLYNASESLSGLVTFIGVIFYLVWLHRVTAAVREAEGSRFTPGMAVGGWFIPFANFVLPALSLGDVYRRVMKGENGWAVGTWWAAYLLTMSFRIFFAVPGFNRIYMALPDDMVRPVSSAVGWFATASMITAYGVWAFILYSVGQKAREADQSPSVMLASPASSPLHESK